MTKDREKGWVPIHLSLKRLRILGTRHLKVDKGYALLIFAFPFQLLLKLRPEPLSILLMLVLILALLKGIDTSAKILSVSLILLIHSQEHSFFIADIAVLAVYGIVYKRNRVFLSLIPLPVAVLMNPYRSLWLSSLYLDTVPRLKFPSSTLLPTELMRPNNVDVAFFLLLFGISFYRSAWRSQGPAFIYAVAGFFLISLLFLIRAVTYVSVFLTIAMALYLSKSQSQVLRRVILVLAVMNPLATVFYPALLMPDYDEALQLEILKEIKNDDRVLCTWDLSPFVIYYTGASVVTAGDIYYIWLSSKELYNDYEEIFSGQKKENIKKFNATVVYFDKKTFNVLYQKMKSDESFSVIAENDRFVAFRVKVTSFSSF